MGLNDELEKVRQAMAAIETRDEDDPACGAARDYLENLATRAQQAEAVLEAARAWFSRRGPA